MTAYSEEEIAAMQKEKNEEVLHILKKEFPNASSITLSQDGFHFDVVLPIMEIVIC